LPGTYPFEQLPRIARENVAAIAAIAQWSARAPGHRELAAMLGGAELQVEAIDAAPVSSAARDRVACAIRGERGSDSWIATISADALRALTQRAFGGPDEAPGERPLTYVERALWPALCAAIIADVAPSLRVWPDATADGAPGARAIAIRMRVGEDAFDISLVGARAIAAPPRAVPGWAYAAHVRGAITLGRCALPAATIERLAVRDLVTLEPPLAGHRVALEVMSGAFGLRCAPDAVVGTVATGYVPRDMSLPDTAHVELTVALGTTELPLAELMALAVGQVVSLGRPLRGPFELRAVGRVIGHGELVDIDGELGVRVTRIEP